MPDQGRGSAAVRVVEHDTGWGAMCAVEIQAIRSILAPSRVYIDHVGSTAIPGVDAKPVIDLLITLLNWDEAVAAAAALEKAGYRSESASLAPPSRFLRRDVSVGAVQAVNLHLTPVDSPYGRDMVVFRDALIGDADLAGRYTALKKQLARDHPEDIEAYTSGKGPFVAKVLREAAGAFGNDRLLTHQRAELNQAQRYQNISLMSQFGVAVVTALSVYSNDNGVQLNLAIVGFVLAFIWFALARKQRAHRSAGDQARRVALLASGLGERFSAEQRLQIFGKFTVPTLNTTPVREESYFASRAAPGYRRLTELIQESAFWTRDLQLASATTLQSALVIIGGMMALALWFSVPRLPADASISMARVLVALLVFLVSSDVIGAIFAHREAASTIGEILHRSETAAARDFPIADVLLLMSDYNAAVESAPFALPGMFKLRRSDLTRSWHGYLETKRQ